MFNQTAKLFMGRVASSLINDGKEPTKNNIEEAIASIINKDKQFYNQDMSKVSQVVKKFL